MYTIVLLGTGPAAADLQKMNDAMADARKAVALAPDLGPAHAALAIALEKNLMDVPGAAREFGEALALSPSDARTNMSFALFAGQLGDTAASLAAANYAVTLDPLSPHIYKRFARALIGIRRFDDALDALRHARQLEPTEALADRCPG